jgi:AraC-like DNA-binding protein
MIRIKLFILLCVCALQLWGLPSEPSLPIIQRSDSLIARFQYEAAKNLINKTLENPSALPPQVQTALWKRLADIYLKFGDGEAALEYGLKALSAAAQSKDSLLIAEAQITILQAQQNIGKDWEAPEFSLGILDLATRHKRMDLLRATHSVMGYYLLNLGDFQKGHDHFNEAQKISMKHLSAFETIYDKLMVSVSLMTLGKLDSASVSIKEANQLAMQTRDSIMLAKSLGLWSFLDLMQGKNAESIAHTQQAVDLARRLNLPLVLVQGLSTQMTLLLGKKDYQAAIKLGNEALEALRTHPNLLVKANLDSLLYICFLQTGDSPKALYHFKSYSQAVQQFSQRYQIAQLKQTEYIQKIKEQSLTIENQNLRLLSEKRKTSTAILLNILIIILTIGSFTFVSLRQKHIQKLFRKEQLISSLMTESEIRRKVNSVSLVPTSTPIIDDSQSDDEAELSEADLLQRKELFDQLLFILEKEKLYLNPEVDRNMLVALLATNKKYLYQATKNVGKTNLSQILNRYRVFEAKKLIEQYCNGNSSELPDDIYARCGFSSKSNYYRMFKDHTGITPKEYAQEFSKSLSNQQSHDDDQGQE